MAVITVKTEEGWVKGMPSGIREYSVFKGIPYAAPPTGENRWRAPQPVKPWGGVRDCMSFPKIIAQTVEDDVFYSKEFYLRREELSEDGLYLNIWTPASSDQEKLPVIAFVHGGGFRSGYSYEIYVDGDAFCKKGVILVTFTYRLGCLGFLAHKSLTTESENHVSGNYGILDQIAALKWIHNNIQAFGGDPENITAFGQSAGAQSIQTLVSSELSKGLISKAILQSCGGYNGRIPTPLKAISLKDAEELGEEFFSLLGVDKIEDARKVSYSDIIAIQLEMEKKHGGITFMPVVDHYVLNKTLDEAVEDSTIQHIPYIIGCMAHENGSFDVGGHPEHKQYEASVRDMIGKKAEEFFKMTGYFENPEKAITFGCMDDVIKPPTLAFCEFMTDRNWDQPIYYYYFDRNIPGDDHPGAFHSADLWYVFDTVFRSKRPMNGKDYDLANTMNSYWCNFAKNGNPNGQGLPEWVPYSAASRCGMELGDTIGMLEYPGTQRMHYLVDYILGR